MCSRVLLARAETGFPIVVSLLTSPRGITLQQGCPIVIPTELVCLHIFIPNKQTTDEVYQQFFCLAGMKSLRKTPDTALLHSRVYTSNERYSRKYLENKTEFPVSVWELQKHEPNHVRPGRV